CNPTSSKFIHTWLRFGEIMRGSLSIYRAWFNEDVDRPRVINELKKQYSEAFTNEEIIKITQFYQTSTGKKLLEKTPQLMQTGAQIAMQEAQAKQSKLIERIRPFLAKHGIKE
ncbi:DUF2059 domain-containing protein, partial [Shewanella xiamenensis]